MPKELLIYCDESVERGSFYSDFYGGVCVSSDVSAFVIDSLDRKKAALHLNNEVKWSRVTENYLTKYIDLMDHFFDLVEEGVVKVRIVFRQNAIIPQNLTTYNIQHAYFLLYYQFIKHAFGLRYANTTSAPLYLRIFFDEFPDSKIKANLFRTHIYGLQTLKHLSRAGIKIRRRDIVEVDSKQHVLLQCLDVVLGSMAFRLNDMHKRKPEGSRTRGKRTIAKEKLYKHILRRIRALYPGFNIGNTTGRRGNPENQWHDPYRHWNFKPKDYKVDETFYK